MELHDRFISFPVAEFSILKSLKTVDKEDPREYAKDLVQHCMMEITNGYFNVKKLNMLRMVLCYEYQLTFHSNATCTTRNTRSVCFSKIQRILFTSKGPQTVEQLRIIADIIPLIVVLYCNPSCIIEHLLKLKITPGFYDQNIGEINHLGKKILEQLLDSLHLIQFLHLDIKPEEMKSLSSLYTAYITLWLDIKENKEDWLLFASMFPKLIKTFGPKEILPKAWDYVLDHYEDYENLLAALSIMIETCLLENMENTISIFGTERLWSLLIQGLKSPVQQYRKQSLFVMKRIIMIIAKTNIADMDSKIHKVVPFVCNQQEKLAIPINVVKQKFFLVLEALEEKQYHLVAPALTHVSSLIVGNQQHASCNDCFNIVWVQLIFGRILQHENINIVKQGIIFACNLDTVIYDHQFLKLFLNILNNTALYECQSYEGEAELLNNIEILFARLVSEKAEFINVLLAILSKITWGPIPVFYMMKTLRMVLSQTSCPWKDNALNNVKFLVQQNLKMHYHVIRIASQIELLKTISISIEKISDVTIVANTLFEFPSEDALSRGTHSWNIVTAWLGKALTKEEAMKFVRSMCEKYLHGDTLPGINTKTFAFMIFMLYDAGLILQRKSCPIEEVLNNWLFCLNGIDMRPYADVAFSIDATEFMSELITLSTIGACESITRLLTVYVHVALKFLLKSMKSVAYKLNYHDINRYLSITTSFLGCGNLLMSQTQNLSYVEKFRNESIRILENIKEYKDMHYLCGLHILYFCQNILNTSVMPLHVQPLLDMDKYKIPNDHEIEIHLRGKIASDYYMLLTKLMHQYLTKVSMETSMLNIDWFDKAMHLYEMGGNEVIVLIGPILKILVEKKAIKNSKDRSNFESIFSMCWKCTFLGKKNKQFFLSIRNLTGVIINNNFLTLPDAMSFTNKFLHQLLEEGDEVPMLKKILLTEMENLNMYHLNKFKEALLLCLLHGSVLRRDQKIKNQACLYITKNYKEYYPEHVSIIDHNTDATVRAYSTVLMHKVINADSEYASEFLKIVLNTLQKYQNKRYFKDSHIHRIKHRVMQILLILQPTLNETSTLELQQVLCNLIVLESNQHSVRLMQEWILIRIFIKNTNLHANLWKLFEKGIETRPACTSSIASIVYHVAKVLPSNAQLDFICTGIKFIARCCLGQQFNMRLYNQVIFVKLYELLESVNCVNTISDYTGLYRAAIESLKDEKLMKNSSRIEDDFYLSIFHPLDNYSLETIYMELPRLADMDMDEWTTPDLFESLNFKTYVGHPLQLHDSYTLLSQVETSIYLTKSSTADNNIEMDFDGLSDIQKKIDPTTSVNPLYSAFPTLRETLSHKKILRGDGIIVVASLVERQPNLGGLARTCEIFNVKELVIANLSHIKDKDFQSLSVSAEKWLTITEIKPHQLQDYLLSKKRMEWHVIGVEQTANSITIENVKYEKKTVLVLGNEKDGIPANLIPLFDTCIEIPQVGIIRSLNVHVTGAICIWEYAKQHVLK